jgi:hypothetical protein
MCPPFLNTPLRVITYIFSSKYQVITRKLINGILRFSGKYLFTQALEVNTFLPFAVRFLPEPYYSI